MRGKHKRKTGMSMGKNPYVGELKELESYGKAQMKKKFNPIAQPVLVKVKKPKLPRGGM